MERRVLLAISLSFAVLFVYQAVFVPKPAPGPSNTTSNLASAPPLERAVVPGNITAVAPTPVPLSAPTIGDTDEREVVLETAKVRAVFTNRGGRLRHWVLKEYRNEQGQ